MLHARSPEEDSPSRLDLKGAARKVFEFSSYYGEGPGVGCVARHFFFDYRKAQRWLASLFSYCVFLRSNTSRRRSNLSMPAEVIGKRSRHIGFERKPRDSFKWQSLPGERKRLQCLAAISVRNQEVHANVDALAREWANQSAAKFADRDRYETVSKRFSANLFVFTASNDVKWQPVNRPQKIPDHPRRFRRGFACEAIPSVSPSEESLHKAV